MTEVYKYFNGLFPDIINPFATLTVVSERQSVYGGLRGRNVRESAQNESSHNVSSHGKCCTKKKC